VKSNDLSSDAGLLLFKEFLFKIGAVKLINRIFKTNDTGKKEARKRVNELTEITRYTQTEKNLPDKKN